MKTEFKIFESDWVYYKIEELIKEYQEKHNAEVKNVVLIRNNDDKAIIGVLFEKRSEDENKWIYREVARFQKRKWIPSFHFDM